MPQTKDKVVPAHLIDANNFRCSECKGNNLVLEGYIQKVYAVRYVDGKVTEEEYSDDPYVHNVQIIHCKDSKCGTMTRIISQELWEAMRLVSEGKGIVPN